MDDVIKEKLALEEMRMLYQKYDLDANQLDSKAANLLSSSSLIITLFGLLQLTLLNHSQVIIYQILLVALFVLYSLLVVMVLIVLLPQKYKTLFEENWEGIEKAILHQKDEKSALMQVISNYLGRVQHNQKINRNKARKLKWITWIFATQMVLVVILSLFVIR